MSISFMGGGPAFRRVDSYTRTVYAWVKLTDMGVPRYGGGAFVYNGRLYLVGGVSERGVTGVVEWVDLDTLERGYGSSMPDARAHFAGYFDGRYYYVVGGVDRGSVPRREIFKYDPAGDSWEELSFSLSKGIAYAASTGTTGYKREITVGIKPSSYGGSADYIEIYVNGQWVSGYNFRVEDDVPKEDFDVTNLIGQTITRVALHHTDAGWSDPTDVWIWDKATGNLLYHTTASSHTWDTSQPNYFEYVSVNWTITGVSPSSPYAVIYLFGGVDDQGNILSDVYAIDTSSGTVTQKASLPSARENMACEMFNGKVYCFGGDDGTNPTDEILVYDPQADVWSIFPKRLPRPLTGCRAVTLRVKGVPYVMVVGG